MEIMLAANQLKAIYHTTCMWYFDWLPTNDTFWYYTNLYFATLWNRRLLLTMPQVSGFQDKLYVPNRWQLFRLFIQRHPGVTWGTLTFFRLWAHSFSQRKPSQNLTFPAGKTRNACMLSVKAKGYPWQPYQVVSACGQLPAITMP